jgi:Fe-S-cluster containining protein
MEPNNKSDNTWIIDGRKVFNCVQCGECCHIRERDKNISIEDEEKYRQYMYSKFGILYLARLTDITINIWPEEAEALKREAKSKDIKLKILPKRAVYDQKHHELIILDYYLDHDICPFFNINRKTCGIYGSRPMICRSYPLLTTKILGKCKHKLDNSDDYGSEKFEAKMLEKMINMQKAIIKSLTDNGSIIIPAQFTGVQLDDIFRTAKYKELRIMDKI